MKKNKLQNSKSDTTSDEIAHENFFIDGAAVKLTDEAKFFLAAIVESSNDSIVTIDLDGAITSWNRAAERLYGYPAHEAIGKPLMMLALPEDLMDVFAKIEDIKQGQKVKIYDTVRVHKDGRHLNLEIVISPVKDDLQRIVGVSTIARDVTEQRKAEVVLRESEAQLRLNQETFFKLVKNTPFGTYIVDADFHLIEISAGAEQVFSNIHPLIGRDFAEILHLIWEEPFATEAIEHFRDTLATGESYRASNNDKQRADIEETESYDWKIERITLPDGRFGVVCYFYDLTELRQAQGEVRRAAVANAFRIQLADTLRPLSDPTEIQAATGRVLGEFLSANRVAYFEVRGADYVVERDYTNDAAPLAGGYPIASFGERLLTAYQNGCTVLSSNTADDALLSADERATYAAIQIGAYIGVPLIKNGKFVAGLAVHNREARDWTAAEIALVEESAERTWSAVNRARAEKNLVASEEQYRILFESIDEGFCIIEVMFDENDKPFDWVFCVVNPAFEKNNGLVNAKNKTIRELAPDIEPKWFEIYGRIAKTGEPLRFEEHSVALARWFSLYAFRISEASKNYVAVIFSDITEHKLAEEAQAYLAAIVKSSDDAIIGKNLDGVITSWNRGAEKLFDYTAAEAVGQPIKMLIPPARRDEETYILDSIRDGKVVSHYETVRRRKDGNEIDISLTVSPVLDQSGAIIGASKIARDITERKNAEEAVRESEERFRSLFNSIDEGFCIIEMIFDENEKPLDYRFVQANPAMEKMTGLKDTLGKTARELVPDLEEFWFETYGKVVLTGEAVRFENFAVPMSRWFEVYASRLGDETNRRVAVVFNNITERKEMEVRREQLLQKEHQAREAAEAATRAKDEFLAIVSHELRNPLNSILGYARLLRTMPPEAIDAAQIKKTVDIIERSGQTQRELINDLLDTVRIISGKLKLEIVPLDLSQLINEAIEVMRPAADAKKIALLQKSDPGVGQIVGDPQRLQQVILNLINNAVKFTQPGGLIYVTLRPAGADIIIQVRDNGKGISPDFLLQIFGRFTQADASETRRHGGLGLGLSLVKQLVELHGGEISAESGGEGKGATFTIKLPAQSVYNFVEETPRKLIMSEADRQMFAGLSLLVIDDEPEARELMTTLLSDYGAEVTAVASTVEGLTLLTDEANGKQFSVLISDIGMPEEDGYSLIRRLREWERSRKQRLPAIALTSFKRTEDRMAAMTAGFQMHVSKPVETEELIAVINSLLGRFN